MKKAEKAFLKKYDTSFLLSHHLGVKKTAAKNLRIFAVCEECCWQQTKQNLADRHKQKQTTHKSKNKMKNPM
jgi:hypothetical protein